MKRLLQLFIMHAILFIEILPAAAQNRWTFELLGGAAYCVQLPLTIQQTGYPDLDLSARYATHSFTPPFYYSLRLARWHDTRAWELELVHLKLELTNAPSEIQQFAISHGYNLLTLNRVWTYTVGLVRVGAGVVIAHPENTVRGLKLDEHGGLFNAGYYVAGPTLQAAVGKRWVLNRHLFVTIEGKITGSYARVPVNTGEATVPNLAFHGLLGFGMQSMR